jgi:hypothetical protein
LVDILVNVPLFVPLGFGLAGLLWKSRMSALVQLLTILGISSGLSSTVEFLQLFLPARSATAIDVFTNGFGGLLGGICFHQWGDWMFSYALRLKEQSRSVFFKVSVKHLMVALLSYMGLAFVTVVFLQTTTLSAWYPSLPLLLNSNRIGTQPWEGAISNVQIASRAVSRKEARQILSSQASQLSNDSLIVNYPLKGEKSYKDQMGSLPNLAARGNPEVEQENEHGTSLSSDRWLETPSPATALIHPLRQTSQFTIMATITPSNIEFARGGMAPVLAIANDSSEYNFILGQKGQLLLLWLRSSLNLNKLFKPHAIIGGLLTDTNPLRLLITYSGSVIRVYSDRSPDEYSFNLVSNNSRVVLLGLVFAPLGLLLTLIAKKIKGGLIFYLALCAGALLPPFLLEGLLISMTNRNISWENLLLGLLIMVSALLIFQGTNILAARKRDS